MIDNRGQQSSERTYPQGVKSTTQPNDTSDRLDESCDNNKSTEVKGRKKKRERANVETADGAHLGVEGRDIKKGRRMEKERWKRRVEGTTKTLKYSY